MAAMTGTADGTAVRARSNTTITFTSLTTTPIQPEIPAGVTRSPTHHPMATPDIVLPTAATNPGIVPPMVTSRDIVRPMEVTGREIVRLAMETPHARNFHRDRAANHL